MKKILLTALMWLWLMTSSVYVVSSQTAFKNDVPVSCTAFGLPNSDQCFESMDPEKPGEKLRLYLGTTKAVSFADTFTNQEKYAQFIFPNGDPVNGHTGVLLGFTPLQGSQWTTPHDPAKGEELKDAFEYPAGLKGWTLSGANYIFFDPNIQDVQFIRMKDNRGSRFMGFNAGEIQKADRNKPLLKFTFTTRAFGSRLLENGTWQPSRSMVSDHNEHVFVYGAWCGDGVLDRDHGEEQDDGVNNGKPGYASTDCKKRPTPTNGVCEPSIDTTRPVLTAPTGNLCKTGVSTPVVEKNGKFTWTCQGANEGVTAACEVPKIPTTNGVCEPSIDTTRPVLTAPTGNLCKTGVSTPVVEKNGKFTWTCSGIAGGTTASCEVPKKLEPQPMCGDGIVQKDRGEICDLGANNGKIINGKIECSLECNIPTIERNVCDQTFHKKVRLGKFYGFSDYYTNTNSYAHTLNSFKVSFKESDDMNKDGKLTYDNFEWASPIAPGSSIAAGARDVKIITASPLYHLNTAPVVRKKDNIYIEYTVAGRGQADFVHKECITYEVTWCGDGVLDTDEGEICDPNDPSKTGWGPGGCNPVGTRDNNGSDISCKPKQGTPLDLSIKKYIETDDAQPNAPVEKDSSSNFNYKIKVKVESGEATGKTTVRDILPAGVELNGNATGDTWTCAYANNTRLLECSSLATIKSGAFFADINVPVRITAQPGSTVRNDATVYNPNEKENPCHENNANITGTEKSGGTPTCEKDPKNTDPAVFKTKHVNDLRIKKYVFNTETQKDGQIVGDALSVDYNAEFAYKYVVTASGSSDQKKVTITDKAPLGVKFTGFEKLPTGWTCNNGQVTDNGSVHHTVICQVPAMTKNTTTEIIVKAQLVNEAEFKKFNLPQEVFSRGLRNVAYVCSEEVKSVNPQTGKEEVKLCQPGCVDPNNPTCTPTPPPPVCSDIPGHPHYDPACIIIESPELAIKKFVKGQDAQTARQQVSIKIGEEYSYTFEVTNTSRVDAKGAVVVDPIPANIQIVKTGEGTGWKCTQEGQLMTCKYDGTIKAGAKAPTITATAKIRDNVVAGTSIRNVSAVCLANNPACITTDNKCKEGDVNCLPTVRDECKPGDINYDPKTRKCDPATVVLEKPELAIKKFVKGQDAQTARDQVAVGLGEEYPYTLEVTNISQSDADGAVVVDPVPANIQIVKTGEGTGWKCTQEGQLMTCKYDGTIKAGAKAPTITAIAKIRDTAKVGTSIRNVAAVCLKNDSACITTDNKCKEGDVNCLPTVRDECKPGDVNYNPTTNKCDPATVTIAELEIKKFVNNDDAQTADKAVAVTKGTPHTYTFWVTNPNTTPVKGAKITDTFPEQLEIIKVTAGTGWTCEHNGQKVACIYNTEIKAGEVLPIVSVEAKIRENVTTTTPIRNVVGVCISDPTKSINDPAQCTPDESKCDVNHPKYDVNTKTCDPAHVVLDELDLSIKKYIDNDKQDAQPGDSAITKSTNTTFNYVIRVKVEAGKTTGITTVTDVLPNGVELNPNATLTGEGWSFAKSNGRNIVAESTQEITSGNYFADIIVPVRVTAGSGNSVRNDAFVHNPNEKPKSCYDGNRIPNGNEGHNKSVTDKTAICTKDPNNSDPAVFTTPTPPPTPTPTSTGYNAVMCIGDVAVVKSYSNLQSCQNELNGISDSNKKSQCYVNTISYDTLRAEAQKMTDNFCKTTPTTNVPYCGDGVLQVGEMCDPGTGRGINNTTAKSDTNTCSATCDIKIKPTTNPGANPIEFYISIPGFAKTLGNTGFNTGEKKLFHTNKMIVGVGSNIFTLADEIRLVLEPKYKTPVQIEQGRVFAITANGATAGTTIESKVDTEGATAWHEYNGRKYFVYGQGDLLVYKGANTQNLDCPIEGGTYKVCHTKPSNPTEVSLFHGSELQGFKGGNQAGAGEIQLAIKNLGATGTTPDNYTSLTEFKVDVTSSRFATSGSSVKRMIQAVTANPTNTTNAFARYVKTDNTATTTNPNNSFPFGTNTVNTATPINANITKQCGTIQKMTDLTAYTHNGNPNVYACKGNLIIEPIAAEFLMTGVKTVLVENGNIVFAKNTKHADSNASWAFIAKDGNIVVKTNVTALEGVLMAIKSTTTTGTETKGEITGENSPNILRIDGMVYGNAKKLFDARTYVRGTNAYDTLTTGTIINYSNRSLRNVPPLLSQYLNAYNVQRVVR